MTTASFSHFPLAAFFRRLCGICCCVVVSHVVLAQANKPTATNKPTDKTAPAAPQKTVATPPTLTEKSASGTIAKPAPNTPATKPAASSTNTALKTPAGAVEAPLSVEALDDPEAFMPRAIDTMRAPMIIGFGSCNRMSVDQNIWPSVAANNPNLWIWLGDIIYADTHDMRELAAHYKRLKTNPNYKQLRSKAQVIGVYDDHDFGKNDSGKSTPTKKKSKDCLLNFLDVPRNQAVRKREGAYQSYTFGKGEQRVKVIVLDTRYFRDSLVPDPTKKVRYLPNTQGTLLGEEQWRWLEQELRNNTASFTLLCSSIQVVSNEHPHEKWGNFPNERKRLLNLIGQVKPKNLMILSGDRHMAEVSSMDVPGLGYPLYDFTSSGLTHVRSGDSEVNKYRMGDLIIQRNFGLLKLAWNGSKPIVNLQIRGLDNHLYQEMVVRY